MEICDYMMEAKPVKIANLHLLFSGHNSKLDFVTQKIIWKNHSNLPWMSTTINWCPDLSNVKWLKACKCQVWPWMLWNIGFFCAVSWQRLVGRIILNMFSFKDGQHLDMYKLVLEVVRCNITRSKVKSWSAAYKECTAPKHKKCSWKL